MFTEEQLIYIRTMHEFRNNCAPKHSDRLCEYFLRNRLLFQAWIIMPSLLCINHVLAHNEDVYDGTETSCFKDRLFGGLLLNACHEIYIETSSRAMNAGKAQ